MKTRKTIAIARFLIIFSFCCPALRAAITGAVEGIIKNSATGEILEGVKITLVFSKSESMTFELHSDQKGHFYRGGLVPGAYNITFEKDGYIPQAASIRVTIEETTRLEVKLEPAQSSAANVPQAAKSISSGIELISSGKYEEAIAKFSESLAQDPSNSILYYYRAYALEKSGKSDAALADYQKAIELKTDFILSLSRAGIVLAKKGDYEKAAEFYKKAIDLSDQDPTTYYNYGVCLINLGKKEEAKAAFEKLVAVDPYYSDGYYQLGIIYIGAGEIAKAKEFLQKFIELDPENKNAGLAKEILKSLN
jgi:tetratricopeptide (TPR) repeat protein